MQASQVQEQLAEVIDPCSCLTPNPVSIVDLGLVREIDVSDGAIRIDLCMTDPMCMYFADIATEIEQRLRAELDWTGEVDVRWDTAADWQPGHMRAAAIRARWEARKRLHTLTPYAERTG
jgi:metal-sulfur cluster biosynthetic enzyme